MESFRVKAITQKSMQSSDKIIGLIIEAFNDLAAEKNIELRTPFLVPVNLMMVTDALEKIMLNLISNAIKYSEEGDTVVVASYKTDSNQLHIIVSDTGIGIDDSSKLKIFERFHRVLNRKSEQITGAGIGLALVKELVTAHNGSIEVDSKLGVGTEFNIYIPIVEENKDENEIEAKEINTALIDLEISTIEKQSDQNEEYINSNDESATQVLVIEDNPDMRSYITDCLSSTYSVSVASNGVDGLEKAIDEVPDIIISDIMMPEMDGYGLTQEIRKNEKTNHIPIILLTAKSDIESRLKGWEEKADEYLTKPFNVTEILIRIDNLISIRNILRRQFSQHLITLRSSEISDEPAKNDLVRNAQEKQNLEFLKKLDCALEKIYQDSNAKVTDLANSVWMSERQLRRKLKAIIDISPSEYIQSFRLKKASVMLAQGRPSNFVALDVGFSSQSYFGRRFKAQFGCSPSEYIESQSNSG